MKFHFGAIIIILVSILGIILFTLTPVISGKYSIYINSNNWGDYRTIAFGFGNGRTDEEGEVAGFPFDNSLPRDIEYIESVAGKAFPIYVPVLVMIGLVFSIIAGLLFFFGDIKTAKTIAIILGILGGVTALAGILSFIEWGQIYISKFDTGFFNVGFFGTIIVSTIVLVLSFMYVFSKPKRKKSVVF